MSIDHKTLNNKLPLSLIFRNIKTFHLEVRKNCENKSMQGINSPCGLIKDW